MLREALDTLNGERTYKHPWLDNADLKAWGVAKHGSDWSFDPLVHHTSEILVDIKSEDAILASTLQDLWAGNVEQGTVFSSYRNRAREIARICGESLDHAPGSIDMQIIERADPDDGFQIMDLMRKATVLIAEEADTSDFVDQDKVLKKIQHKFMQSGVHTYVAAYKRQLRLFVEMKLPFQLPEQYNCQRMIAHLSKRCQEFKKCAQDFADLVKDKRAKYTYAAVERVFTQCEVRHSLGPSNHGTPVPGQQVSPTSKALLALGPDDGANKVPPFKKNRGNPRKGSFKKGACPIHPGSTTHDLAGCFVNRKRREFVHPVTGKKGLTQADICPDHPQGWHPRDLCGDPRFLNWSRKNRGRNIASMVSTLQKQKKTVNALQQQLGANNASAPQQQFVPLAPQAHQQPQLVQMAATHTVPAQQWARGFLPASVPMQLNPPAPQLPVKLAQFSHPQLGAYLAQQQPITQSAMTSPSPASKTTPRKLVYSNGALNHIDHQINSARF